MNAVQKYYELAAQKVLQEATFTFQKHQDGYQCTMVFNEGSSIVRTGPNQKAAKLKCCEVAVPAGLQPFKSPSISDVRQKHPKLSIQFNMVIGPVNPCCRASGLIEHIHRRRICYVLIGDNRHHLQNLLAKLVEACDRQTLHMFENHPNIIISSNELIRD